MAEKLIVIDKVEELHDNDGNVVGRTVYDKKGDTIKVKSPRGTNLKERWSELDEGIGLAFRFTMADYKTPQGKVFPYVSNFEKVAGVFEQEAAQKVAEQMSDGKNRSYALSYSKDWCIACKQAGDDVKTTHILSIAAIFEVYLDKGITKEE